MSVRPTDAVTPSRGLRERWRNITPMLIWVIAASSSTALAQPSERDLILFTSVSAIHSSGLTTNAFDDSDTAPSIALMYSQAGERFRFHGEVLVTDEEHEVERLQFGWRASEATRLWIGRVHTPGSYWNTQFHHSQFLQTSIARPSIDAYEHVGGVLPMHMSGLLVAHRAEFDGGGALQLEVATGVSSRLEVGQLETFDIVDPESGFKSSFDMRVDYLPDVLGSNLVGLSFGRFEIPISSSLPLLPIWDPSAKRFEIDTVGIHGNWETDRWRIIADARRVAVAASGGVDTARRTLSWP